MTAVAEHPTHLDIASWAETFGRQRAQGFEFFDFLTAYETASGVTVVARVQRSDDSAGFLGTTTLDDTMSLPSLTSMYPGATWFERETAEMFGVQFLGLVDDRFLLRHERTGQPPMLKSSVLAARAVIDWPGAAEPDTQDGRRRDNPSRRRMRPLGSPPPGWGERS